MDEASEVRYPDVNVKLTGEDGNAAVIISRVRSAIHRKRGQKAANDFATEAFEAGSYDEVLRLCMKTVNVS